MKTSNLDYRVSGYDLGMSQPVFNMIKEQCKFGYVKVGELAEPAIQLPNSAAFISAYINQPGADKSTAGKFAHKADEIARLAHSLDNADGPVGNVRLYDNIKLKGTPQRGKGLVVLAYGGDNDLDADDEPPCFDPVLALKKGVVLVDTAIV